MIMFLKLFKLLFAAIFILHQFTFVISVAASDNKDSISHHDSQNFDTFKRQTTGGCQVPDNPPHTKYEVVGYNATYNESGSYVPNYTILKFTCDPGYNDPTGSNFAVCISNTWTSALKDCKRTCPSLTSITSTNVKCQWTDIPLENCSNPVEGTTAFLSCNPLYEDDSLQKNPIRLCKSGRWNPPISQCHPTCGLKRPQAKLNIFSELSPTTGDYPWQAGIYNTEKKLLCEGSIIDQSIILSVASCFTDDEGNVLPTKNFLVAAGKYYREYSDARDAFAQYSDVFEIHVPERYKGNKNLYPFDIAVIVLKDSFKLSSNVQPVCIDLSESFDFSSNNYSSIVTGWSNTHKGKEPAEVLQENIIQYVPYQKCYSEIPDRFKTYLTFDKICGKYIKNGAPECANYKGAGLFSQNKRNNRYYLRAIVSGSPASGKPKCDSNEYILYTSIHDHIAFIRHFLAFRQQTEFLEDDEDYVLL